jgi:spore coat polysaccharide biosynthesis predicted glycosyltransferase SpsG
MRVMSLAEELGRRGFEIILLTSPSGIAWLEELLQDAGIRTEPAVSGELGIKEIEALEPDICVVDSYRFETSEVSALAGRIPLVMVCDGDARGVDAALYVDHNLGASAATYPAAIRDRILAGASFAITRDEVLRIRGMRSSLEENAASELRIRCVAGGSDFNDTAVAFAQILVAAQISADILFITDELQESQIRALDWSSLIAPTFSRPTRDVLSLLMDADLVLSAAGTTAWDLMTMGLPACLTAVVANQEPSLVAVEATGVALSLGTLECMKSDPSVAVAAISRMASERDLRVQLSARATEIFDGLGRVRIADQIDRLIPS